MVAVSKVANSMVGGGLWQPEAAALAKLRRNIDRKPHKIKRVLADAGIRQAFLGNVADDEKKAVKAFVNLTTNQSSALKRNPKVRGHSGSGIWQDAGQLPFVIMAHPPPHENLTIHNSSTGAKTLHQHMANLSNSAHLYPTVSKHC